MKLKYEIMARNQVNQRLSEMNEFLSEQQKEHDQDERKKADVTDAIQKDLAKRLQISRDELIAIKQEMRGKYDDVKRDSVYGIKFKLMLNASNVFAYKLKIQMSIFTGTENGILHLQNQLKTRQVELSKERKIRKQLEVQFENKTEKRLIQELLPNRTRIGKVSNSFESPPRPSFQQSGYNQPIPVSKDYIINNNRYIRAPKSTHQDRMKVGAYF